MAFGGKFIHCIRNELFPGDKNESNEIKIAFVLVSRENDKKAIKSYLDRCGCVSQFLLLNTMKRKVSALAVMGNILKQVNAKVGCDNWRLDLPKSITDKHTMFVGLDVCQVGRKSIIGMAASSNQHGTQYFSRLANQKIGKDLDGKTKRE